MKLKECLSHASLALRLGQLDYSAELCRAILEVFPHHVRAHIILGQLLLERGQFSAAGDQFEAVLACDPENVVARSGLAVCLERQGQLKRAIVELQKAFEVNPGNTDLRESLLSLRRQLDRVRKDLDISPAAASRILLKRGRYDEAARRGAEALQASPNRPDLLLCRAEALWRMGRRWEAETACRGILQRSPNAIKAKLILASLLLHRGVEVEGVSLLHEALAIDPSLTVAGAILHDAGLSVQSPAEAVELPDIAVAVPYDVKAALSAGLPLDLDEEQAQEDLPLLGSEDEADSQSGQVIKSWLDIVDTVSETLGGAKRTKTAGDGRHAERDRASLVGANHSKKDSLLQDRLGLDGPSAAKATRPSYLVVSSVTNLTRRYGREKTGVLDHKLRLLVEALGKEGYASHLLYVDSAEKLSTYGLSPVDPRSPQAIKSLLGQLEAKVAGPSPQSRYVLLIGGDDIVPFHRLINPTEDDDLDVLSDIPYATLGANNFAPVRAVGRLPDEASTSPSLLFYLVDSLIAGHTSGRGANQGKTLLGLVPPLSLSMGNGKLKSLGYSALVWRMATETVYEAIGDKKSLRVCPPLTERSVEAAWFRGNKVNLFNLHGTENSPFWYGQKDAAYPADYPLFPIALSPDIVKTLDISDSLVISEACYGANIIKKTVNDSLALQFLKGGAACLIGSTRIAYGSSEPPLVGADLLAKLFWQQLLAGVSVGEALTKAKTGFVRDVQERQGYLDGDDQKTVLEFVVLGDPSQRWAQMKSQRKALIEAGDDEPDFCPSLYCMRKAQGKEEVRVPGEVLAKVRRFLQKSAPDILDSHLSVLPREVCLSGKRKVCQGTCLLMEGKQSHSNAFIMTTRRAVFAADGAPIQRVARVTVDPRGGILKLAVSK